jgi:hypothetical protein
MPRGSVNAQHEGDAIVAAAVTECMQVSAEA